MALPKITHTDPALHTVDAYVATATRLRESNPSASILFDRIAAAQNIMDSPASQMSSPNDDRNTYAFAIDDYALDGVWVTSNGTTRSVFDEELRKVVEHHAKHSKTFLAVNALIGRSDGFAEKAGSLTPGTVEYDQALVFAERLDERLRTFEPIEASLQTCYRKEISEAQKIGRQLFEKARNRGHLSNGGKQNDSGLFQANYAGEANVLFAVREAPVDVLFRKTEKGYAIQVDEKGARQIIDVERAEDAVALFQMGLQVLAQDRKMMFNDHFQDGYPATMELVNKMKKLGLLAAEYDVSAHKAMREDEHRAKGGAPHEFTLGKDSAGRTVAVWPGQHLPPGMTADDGYFKNHFDDGPVQVERHFLVPLDLPAELPREFAQKKSLDEMREEMVGIIQQNTLNRPDNEGPLWTFQIQASLSEIREAVAQNTDAVTMGASLKSVMMDADLMSRETVATLKTFSDAVVQPEFKTDEAGHRERTGTNHRGLVGLDHLKKTFGPGTAFDLVNSRVKNLEMHDPAYRQVVSRRGMGGRDVNGSSYDDQDRMERARHNARRISAIRILKFEDNRITNPTPTRAVHIDRDKAIAIVRSLPDKVVARACHDLRHAHRNSITRVEDRWRMHRAMKDGQKEIDAILDPAAKNPAMNPAMSR
ncbi:MAG: hypothetical protein K2X45_13070 [Phreatobacter sp.]|nr:hypothetical protein [Phreatobacter sp.]